MSAQVASTKRAYLNRDDRRAQLLECAAAIVDREGWSALTMVSLAKEAKGSRQLVYQHFSSVTQLVTDTADHLFEATRDHIWSVFREPSNTTRESLEQAARITFDLPLGRVAALLQLMVIPFDENRELGKVSRRLRKASTAVARELAKQSLPDWPEGQRESLVAMMDLSLWAMHLGVSDGLTDKETAIRVFIWNVESLLKTAQEAHHTGL